MALLPLTNSLVMSKHCPDVLFLLTALWRGTDGQPRVQGFPFLSLSGLISH